MVLEHLVPGPYDYPEQRFLRYSTHIARQTHDCAACRKLIHPGEQYTLMVYTEDDEFIVRKSHTQRL